MPTVLRTVLSYQRPDGLYIAPSLDWTPVGGFADYANTVRTPGYALLGLQAGMKLPQGFSVYVDARNLTDQRYISDVAAVINASSPANQQIYYPGDGRAIFVGARLTF
ncbi:TonB-dependent receptor [Methylocella silvestris]|uniref:TonB-dependent receptor n=1 Tax=Methylocella silvestris TaxID=199596 RepID=UPI0001724BD9|nr:TonB-dependent receptor [Methylocella silvestris]